MCSYHGLQIQESIICKSSEWSTGNNDDKVEGFEDGGQMFSMNVERYEEFYPKGVRNSGITQSAPMGGRMVKQVFKNLIFVVLSKTKFFSAKSSF